MGRTIVQMSDAKMKNDHKILKVSGDNCPITHRQNLRDIFQIISLILQLISLSLIAKWVGMKSKEMCEKCSDL